MDKILNYFKADAKNISVTHNQELININCLLNNLNYELGIDDQIKIPTLVTIGSQSSGKSSIINRLLKLNIIPTGSVMETRTPINIELIHTEKEYFIEFGEYNNFRWKSVQIIQLSEDNTHELEQIKNKIKFLTQKYAGEEMGISYKEINIKLYSPFVSNLNFIDLPGLTMIACTDKGQPKDIKEQIRNLLIKYIKADNNLILCIMPAREDLETDIALDLVKQYDKEGKRTIGVLTKIDLMNKNNNICNYLLNNNISKDLQLDYGYYAIKNSNTRNFDIMATQEDDFFNKNKHYSDILHLNRMGIHNLNKSLSDIFLTNIKKNIPQTLNKINSLIISNNKELQLLGDFIGDNDEVKEIVLTKYITNIINKFNDNIDNRCGILNTGRIIKETFTLFKKNINELDPFNSKICSEEMLTEIIKNSDGNHMSLPIPTIEIIEACILDTSINCIEIFTKSCIDCCENIYKIIKDLVNNLIIQEDINRYPELCETLTIEINNNVIEKEKSNVLKKIKEIIEMEKAYIWTDDTDFEKVLIEISKNELNTSFLRTILKRYFDCIKKIINHNIPKIIMLTFIRKIQKNLQIFLLNKLQSQDYVKLLNENPEIKLKRTKFKNIISVLKEAQNKLKS